MYLIIGQRARLISYVNDEGSFPWCGHRVVVTLCDGTQIELLRDEAKEFLKWFYETANTFEKWN